MCRDDNKLVSTDSIRHDQKPHHVQITRKKSVQYQLHQAVMAQPYFMQGFLTCCLQTLKKEQGKKMQV